jgi:catalase
MLQARIFSYADAHRYRLGVNHDLIPVNKPRCPVMNYHRDGFMRVDENGGGRVNYEPNSFNGPVQLAAFDEPPLRITGDAARYNRRDGNDDYTQAGNLFRLMNPQQRERLFGNTVRHMQAGNTPQEIQLRQLCHFFRADPGYGFGVAKALGIELSEDVVRNLVSASTGDGELVATEVPSSH